MSNRILGILIILGFILSGVLFYMYFFVYYMGNITIKSNISDYSIELYNKKLIKTKEYKCEDKKCYLKDISPFEYGLKIMKSGYVDIEKDIKISRNEKLNIDIVLNKKTILNEIKTTNNIEIIKEISNKDKIAYLKNKKSSYFYKKINNINFYFKQEGKNLRLYYDNIDLGVFEKENKDQINISEILGNIDYIFIQLANKKYLYSLVLKNKYPFELNIDINYIKIGESNQKFIINTTKGSFIYDKYTFKLEYFDFFRDFIYYKSGYIGVIDKTDKRRLINLGLENITENLIIYYNTDSKEKKILLETPLNIQKIYKTGEDIMFSSVDNKEYKLENY